jgi:hypothetical protein
LGISKSQWRKRRGRLCSPADFRELIRSSEAEHGIIQSKDDGKGIPQGSPISAILSNIYMLDLDTRLARVAKEHNGAYWRYSDDILIACPIEAKSGMEAQLRSSIAQVKLELNDQKTARPEFRHAQNSGISASQPLQYLGFTFDGEKVRVRPQTVVRYMRRMRRAVRQEKMLARRQSEHGGDGTIRRKRLYSRFTHLGKRNFISYARKAKDVFPVNGIRDQIKHHWRDLHAELVVE